jgi:hypothetical protein
LTWSPAELREISDRGYEDRIVNLLFRRYGLPDEIRLDMICQHRAQTGEPRLTLFAFHERFPTFPVFLAAVRLGGPTGIKPWFDDFPRLEIVRAYSQAAEEITPSADGMPFGIVFRAGHMKDCILHNAWRWPTADGVSITWQRAPAAKLVVEPFPAFLRRVDRHATGGSPWQP